MHVQKKYIKNLFTRVLVAIILFLVSSIFINFSDKNLLLFKKYLYNQTFDFAYINKFYNKYLGGVLPKTKLRDETVSSDHVVYKEINKYYDGVKLKMNNQENIKVLQSGIVVFIGEKENYGNTVIIQGSDSVDYWYSNLENIGVKLYDYVLKDNIIGTIKDEYLYMVFSKNGEFLNYEEFIQG